MYALLKDGYFDGAITNMEIDGYTDIGENLPPMKYSTAYRYVETDSGFIWELDEVKQNELCIAIVNDYIKVKINEIGEVCRQAIYKGIDVVLSDGLTHHFSLTYEDQINIMEFYTKIMRGDSKIKYHEDDGICKFYSVEDATLIMNKAYAYKEYHTTYCNMLNNWIRSCTTQEELDTIYYGIELPIEYDKEFQSLIGISTILGDNEINATETDIGNSYI